MKLPKSIKNIGGGILYINFVLLALWCLRCYIKMFQSNWKYGLFLTLTSIGFVIFGIAPYAAFHVPQFLLEKIENAPNKSNAFVWTIGGFLGGIIVPWLIWVVAVLFMVLIGLI